MSNLFSSYSSQSLKEPPDSRTYVRTTNTVVSQDLRATDLRVSELRAQGSLASELQREVQEERRERMADMEAVMARLERQQKLLAEIRESQPGINVIKAAEHEKKEMLTAIATLHNDVEHLRDLVLSLRNGRDGAGAKLEAEVLNLRALFEAQQREQAEVSNLRALFEAQQREQEQLKQLVLQRPSAAPGAPPEAVEALRQEVVRLECAHVELRNRTLQAMQDDYNTRHAGHDQKHAGLAERVDRLDATYRSMDATHKSLKAMQDDYNGRHAAHDQKHASLAERMDRLDSNHKTLEARHGEHDRRLAERDMHHETLRERVDRLYHGHAELQDGHAKAMDSVNSMHERHNSLTRLVDERARALDEATVASIAAQKQDWTTHMAQRVKEIRDEMKNNHWEHSHWKSEVSGKVDEKHTQVQLKLQDLRQRQEEMGRQLVDSSRTLHETTAASAAAQQQELAAQRDDLQAAISFEVQALRHEVRNELAAIHKLQGEQSRLQAEADAQGGASRELYERIDKLQTVQGELKKTMMEAIQTSRDGLHERVDRLDAAHVELRNRTLQAMQQDVDGRFSERDRLHAVLTERLDQMDRLQSAKAAHPDRDGLRERVDRLDAAHVELRNRTLQALQQDYDGRFTERDRLLTVLTERLDQMDRQQQSTRAVHPEYDVLRERVDKLDSAHVELRNRTLQALQQDYDSRFAERDRHLNSLSDRLEQVNRQQNLKALQQDYDGRFAERDRHLSSLHERVEQVTRQQSLKVEPRGTNPQELADIKVQVSRDTAVKIEESRQSTLEVINSLFDQSCTRATEANKACEVLSLQLRKEEEVRVTSISEIRQQALSSVEQERRERMQQDDDLRRCIEQETQDRITDAAEQRQALVRAMREWHAKRMAMGGGPGDEERFERTVLGQEVVASPPPPAPSLHPVETNKSRSWFDWSG